MLCNPTGPITTLNFQAGTLKNVAEINGGGVGLAKTSAGALTISGNNTYSGPTTVTQGTLTLGNNNAIKAGTATPVSSLVLNGGTFATGGFSDTLGTLTLAANSILDLGTGNSVLHFASSNDTARRHYLERFDADGEQLERHPRHRRRHR